MTGSVVLQSEYFNPKFIGWLSKQKNLFPEPGD